MGWRVIELAFISKDPISNGTKLAGVKDDKNGIENIITASVDGLVRCWQWQG